MARSPAPRAGGDARGPWGAEVIVDDVATVVSAPSVGAGLVRSTRPMQWGKNLLVFAAPGAAGVLDDWPQVGRTVIAFVAFCLAASGLYVWNDVLDVDADRLHPVKCNRPIAAGVVPLRTARVAGSVLVAASAVVAAGTGRWQTVAVLATYVVTTMAYSAWLKHIAVIDLLTIASGFVLRAAGGAVAVDVTMSKWFVLCTVFGSLFIVTGKRFAELRDIGDEAAAVRVTLGTYTAGYLRIVLAIACGAAMMSYCLWAFETKELADTTLPFYELSIVPVLAALLRYLLVLENGGGAAPEEVFARDRVLQVMGAAWLVLFGLGVYLR
jgi:decaprenyl-phosphate phosphoribosyltransferase